jgi:HEAT repeats
VHRDFFGSVPAEAWRTRPCADPAPRVFLARSRSLDFSFGLPGPREDARDFQDVGASSKGRHSGERTCTFVRYWAIALLAGVMEDPSVALAVASHAGDGDANVRAAVAESLGGVDARVARPLLRRLLRDDAFFVRSHAARAVARAGDTSLAPKLGPLLADGNWWVRAAVKESLLRLGAAGLKVAQAALASDGGFARDGALEIILGSGYLAVLIAAADRGDRAAQQAVAVVRAETSEWTIESRPAALSDPAPAVEHRGIDAAVA